MAGGNLGDLWVSLGIKETVSDGLKKVLVSLDKTDEKSAAVGKEIKSFVKELNNASVSDSLLKSIGRIGELLSSSASGAESLGRVLKGLDIKELSLLGGKVNLSNLNEAHSLITKIMSAMASGKMPSGSLDKFFDLGNAQAYLTQIMSIDKNLKSLKDHSKGVTDGAMKNEAKTYIDGLTNLRKKFLESFNSNSWRNSNDLKGQLDEMTNGLIRFYDKLNASKGTPTLFDSLSKDADKATESLRNTEAQAKKTAEAVSSIGSAKNPPKMREAKQEASFNKEVDKIVGDSKSRREAQNELGGVKDAADKTKESVVRLKYELNEVLNAFRGAASKNLGVGDAGEKGRQLVDILNQINRKKAELSTREGGDKLAAEMGSMVNNAMTYIRLLQRIDIAQRNIADKKSANPNIDASKFKEATAVITNFREKLTQLESSTFVTGVDSANVLGNYAKAWQVALGQVDEIIGKFQKRNPLSDLDSNFSKIDSKIDSFREKLAKLRDLMSEGTSKGFNTSMLADRITGMSGIVAQMEKALANDGKILSNADRMKQLFNDMSVELSKTTAAFQTYGREKGKVIAQEREHDKELEKSRRNQKELADNTRKLADLYSYLGSEMAKAEKYGMRGLGLGVDTSSLDKALSDMRDFASLIQGVRPGLMGKGGKPVFEDYKQQATDLVRALRLAIDAQKELNSAREKSNAKKERDNTAQENKRLSELKIAEQRYNALDQAIWKLRREADKSIALNVDTTKIDGKIRELESKLMHISSVKERLEGKDYTTIGMMGNIGTGRDTTLAGRVLTEQKELNRLQEKLNSSKLKTSSLEKEHEMLLKQSAKAQADLIRGFERANNGAGRLNSTMQDLKSLFLQGGLVYGAQQFAMSIITTGGEMEKQHIALQSILGDIQNANTLFGQVKELALNSPFTFSELNRDVKQLAAYGVEYDDLYDTTKRLADMSSGLGVSFDRIALAFGQVQARGWLDGKELRQISYAGIPLLGKLSEFYTKKEGKTVTTSDVKSRISKREVGFDDVKSIFWKMTDEGGEFHNMQKTLSETLLGRYNKMKDAWEIMLSDLASGESEVGDNLKSILDVVTDFVQNIHSSGTINGTLGIITGFVEKLVKLASFISPIATAAIPAMLFKRGVFDQMGGSTASNYLKAKGGVASGVMARVAEGKQISDIEREILRTKNQITEADVRNLAEAKALTKADLDRLMVSGKITKEIYKQNLAILQKNADKDLMDETARLQKQGGFQNKARIKVLEFQNSLGGTMTNWQMNLAKVNGFWGTFASRGLAAVATIGRGIAGIGKMMWGTIGGLPGLIFTVGFSVYEYFAEKQRQLEADMNRTADELKDRYKQIGEFLKSNDISDAISSRDEKAIDSLIETYKEKLKDLAPTDYNFLVMTSEEKDSHEDRLKYLKSQLELIQQANLEAQKLASDKDSYKDMRDDATKMKEYADALLDARDEMNAFGSKDKDIRNYMKTEKEFNEFISQMAETYKEKIKNLGASGRAGEAAYSEYTQIRESMLSLASYTEEEAQTVRAALDNALGLNDHTTEDLFANKLLSMIGDTFPDIANDIKANKELDKASQEKVKAMMGNARDELLIQFPFLKKELQDMLDKADFKAIIKLAYQVSNKFTPFESQIWKNFSNTPLSPGMKGGLYNIASPWLKEGNFYDAMNKGRSSIDEKLNVLASTRKAYNNRKATKEQLDAAKKEYDNTRRSYKYAFGEDYAGEGKKSNKTKKTRGRQEDEDLKRLRKRIELYKKFYTELEKYRKLYGRSGALAMLNSEEEFKPVFKNFGLSDPGTYGTSIRELLSKVPITTNDRKDYRDLEIGNIHAKNRSEEEDRIKTENDQLSKRLDILSEQYETYKKLYELTGNSDASSQVAFGHVQSGTFKDYLNEQMNWAVQDHNNLFGSSFTPEEVFGMDENDFKQYFGENSENISVLYDAMRKENEKLKKETIDLMADLIEKNATIEQQIEDENRRYERQLELIKGIDDPKMRQRASDGAEKTHNENNAKLQFELFKESSDWVTIFDDLDRVSSSTIDSMVGKIDEFSKTAGLSVEVVKQLRDALGKLKDEQIERNPLPSIFGGVRRGNAIGSFIKDRLGNGADGSAKVYVSSAEAKRMGIVGNKAYTKNELENEQKGAYNDSSKAIDKTAAKMQALASCLDPVVNLFRALGKEDSILGKAVGGASNAFSAAANVSGGLNALGLGNLGPYGAAAAAAISVAGSLISAFGADYSSYNKAKEQYETLSSVWDSLISKKTEYMNIHWGTEATEASKEAQEMLQAEIEQTKIIARMRLNSGSSAGSHSIGYRMWKGSYKYNGQNWRDVAPEISRKYGVQFNGMEDMLNMNADTLSKIKRDYTGLWANLDSDYRDYLEKLIEYGDKADEMIDNLTEKLTGNKFSSLVESWGEAMASMSNSSDSLVDNFEENLKKTILNSMIEDLYGDQIKAILAKAKKYGDPKESANWYVDGKYMGAYTQQENAEIRSDVEHISKQVEATRDFFKKTYGWPDNSSSSSTNSIKGITEETADLLASYLNAIRLDCSVIRAEQAKYFPEMNEIAKSQLAQLGMITQNTLRNAEAAERIETVVASFNDNFNKVLNGTKKLNVK